MGALILWSLLLVLVVLSGIGVILWKVIDWRKIFTDKFSGDWKKGLAWIDTGDYGEFVPTKYYSPAVNGLFYKRKSKDKQIDFVLDFLPDEIGFKYDKYSGRRIYAVKAGSTKAYPIAGAMGSYPEELFAPSTLDRIAVKVSKSVKTETGLPWGIVALVIIVVVIIGVIGMNVIKGQQRSTQQNNGNVPAVSGNVTVPDTGAGFEGRPIN